MPRAFKSLMFRLMFFFVGGSFCVGVSALFARARVSRRGADERQILVPYDEPKYSFPVTPFPDAAKSLQAHHQNPRLHRNIAVVRTIYPKFHQIA